MEKIYVVVGSRKPSLRARAVESSGEHVRSLGVGSHGREVVVRLGRPQIPDLEGQHLDREMNESPAQVNVGRLGGLVVTSGLLCCASGSSGAHLMVRTWSLP